MQKQPKTRKELKKEEIIGSETVMEKIKRKTPWVLGNTLRKPPALGATQGGDPIFILKDINEAFIIESIVASILILLCSTGFVFLYQASKYVYNRKMAITILIIGLLTIIICFIALQYIIAVKTGVLAQ